MTDRDQIIAWAREAGGSYLGRYDLHQFTSAELQALIRIVAAHERGQCASLCENIAAIESASLNGLMLKTMAAAIRGRAEK